MNCVYREYKIKVKMVYRETMATIVFIDLCNENCYLVEN